MLTRRLFFPLSCSFYQSRTVKTIRPLQDPARGQTRVITAREVDERQAVYRKPPTPSTSTPPPPPPPPPTDKGTIAPCELPIVQYVLFLLKNN
ncbi:hypothetical protein DPMN_137697 [Dreissena polymorpha]|uniref:Uncharacterized protein n=1 Tax=Dreissena polymorpha TaxID=45954 RepID=A0A9D4G2B0_DREPO|nr:hypothetical protein DPMN_137697 [Dreissena polymorpha]